MFVSEDFCVTNEKFPNLNLQLATGDGIASKHNVIEVQFHSNQQSHLANKVSVFNLSIPLLRLWRYAIKPIQLANQQANIIISTVKNCSQL